MSGVFCVSCQGRHRRLQTGREIGVNSNVVEAETAQEIIATSRAAHIHSCTARYFSSHCNGGRLKRDEDRDRLTRNTSRSYFALKASVSSGNGAHDECNIFRQLNERRRSDGECSVASPNAVRRQKCGVSYGGSACHARLPAVPAESECGESPANEIRHFYRGLVARVLISWQSESGYHAHGQNSIGVPDPGIAMRSPLRQSTARSASVDVLRQTIATGVGSSPMSTDKIDVR